MKKIKRKRDGQQQLLSFLYEKHGGDTKVAKLLKVKPHTVNNWKVHGVPAKDLAGVATALKIPMYGLNYKKVKQFLGVTTPSWAKVVGMYKFSKDQIKELIRLGEPK